jgi:CheY-like chemotaxis protein
MNESSVLVVEDDDDLRATVADLLRDEGVEVAEVANGAEALGWMHAHGRPTVILLDLMMPKMDGMQFRRAQLAEPDLATVPVVLMTASTVHQPIIDAAGINDVLHKPLEAETLLSMVRRYVS